VCVCILGEGHARVATAGCNLSVLLAFMFCGHAIYYSAVLIIHLVNINCDPYTSIYLCFGVIHTPYCCELLSAAPAASEVSPFEVRGSYIDSYVDWSVPLCHLFSLERSNDIYIPAKWRYG
jgi:hypothetical protein